MTQTLLSDYSSPHEYLFEPTVRVGERTRYPPDLQPLGKTLTQKPSDAHDAEAITKSDPPTAKSNALAACAAAGIEVISATPEWIELCVPCDLATNSSVQRLLINLLLDVPTETREAITLAFREMLSNAIEYGCHLHAADRIDVRFIRLKRAIICRIKDPGNGFDPGRLAHAAICNPGDDPIHHVFVREEKGLRPGGFGILLTSKLVDELVYNERHNELLFVKYLS